MAKAKAKTEKRTTYIYLCRRTCFYEGKRWFAGTEYEFNKELPTMMGSHFEPLRESKRDLVRDEHEDELAYEVVGREKNRPSEYQTEV